MTATTKLCPRCEMTHPTACFYKSKATKDGLQGWCRTCMNEASKHSQGMKREKMRELKEILDNSDLGYRILLQELKDKYKVQLQIAAVKYHKEYAQVLFDFGSNLRGEANGQIERKAAEGPTEFGVRSTQP